MNIQSSKRHSAVTLASFATLSGLAFGVAFEPGQSNAAGREVIAETNQLLPTATNRADTESYTLEIKPVGTYAVGKEGTVDVVLTTKAPYHVNDAYPYKFRAPEVAAEGVTYPKPLLTRADGKFDEKTGTFHVPFVVSKAGKTKVGGTFSLSVCSTSNCLMEKVDLEVDVDVK
jgi:hypothetical protein